MSEKHILWIHLGENIIDIWGGTDFGPYSSQSFGHKSITLSKHFTLIFSFKGQSTIKCFSFSISPLEQFVHFLSGLIMFLYLPVSIFNEWALTLILQIDCRILKLLISKYFSFPKWVFMWLNGHTPLIIWGFYALGFPRP